jgi:antitoxin HicB
MTQFPPGALNVASGQWRQRVPKTLPARLVQRATQENVSLNTLVTAMIAEGVGHRQGRGQRRASS